MVQIQKVGLAAEIMKRGQETVWPAMGWSGQNQQMLHGKASQSMFVWTSVWPDLAAWEQGMKRTSGNQVFLDWYKDWNDVVDFGGPREIFRNL